MNLRFAHPFRLPRLLRSARPHRFRALLLGFALFAPLSPCVAQPPNDDFAAAEVIAGLDGSSDGTTEGATVELEEPAHGGVQCGNSVWYRWTAPETSPVTFTVDTEGAFFIAAYTGQFLDTIESIGNNGATFARMGTIQSPAATQPFSFRARAGRAYYIAVDTNPTFDCETGPFSISWQPANGPANDFIAEADTIEGLDGSLQAPLDGATYEGESPIPVQTLAGPVGFSPANSVWYRWTPPSSACVTLTASGGFARARIGVFLPASKPGALRAVGLVAREDNVNGTVERLQLRVVAGTEYLISLGTVFARPTGPVSFRWTFAGSGPPNDNFADAEPIAGTDGFLAASNVGATKECGEPARFSELNSLGLSGPSIWYRWTAPTTARTVFTTDGSNFDTMVWVYQGRNLNELTERATNDDIESVVAEAPETKTSFAAFNAQDGVEYFIAVDGWNLSEGSVVLNWATVPRNDNFANAEVLTGITGVALGNNVAALSQPEEPLHANVAAGRSVWFDWTAPDSRRTNFQVTPPEGLRIALLAVYTGDDLADLTTVVSVDGSTLCTPQCSDAIVSFVANRGTKYRIAVSGRQDSVVPLAPPLNVGPFLLTWYPLGAATPTRLPSSTPTAIPSPTRTVPSPTRTRRPTATPGPPFGDANCDGLFTAADLPALLMLIPTGDPGVCGFADANDDGAVDADDIVPTVARIFEQE